MEDQAHVTEVNVEFAFDYVNLSLHQIFDELIGHDAIGCRRTVNPKNSRRGRYEGGWEYKLR